MSHQDPVLEYQQAIPTSRWAVFIFIASIVSAILCFLIVPSLLVLPTAFAIYRNLKDRMDMRGAGLASAAARISSVSLILGVAIVLLWPSRGGSGLSNRSTCAANLRGITQTMNVYAADGDWYPIVGASYSSTLASSFPGPTGTPDTLLSNKPGGLYAPANPIGNVCQSMWILVINGQVAAKQFICKSDPAGGSASFTTVPGTSNFYANFTAGPGATPAATDQTYSYSFAFPWTAAGKIGDWWHSDTDASLPLIADIAPANGTGSVGALANTLDGTKKAANSRNHQGDGQNIGYGDGHAEFARLANAGHRDDNIYSANGAGGPSPLGTTPSSAANPVISGGSKGNWDIILVPAADVSTNVRK